MFRQNKLGVPASGESPYQVPTFNTTDWYTGEYQRPASCRIRFQRSTQQISTLPKRRTGDWRPASRRIRFQRSLQQIGTPSNWRTDVSAPNVTTQQISTPAYRRPASVELIRTPSVADKMPQHAIQTFRSRFKTELNASSNFARLL